MSSVRNGRGRFSKFKTDVYVRKSRGVIIEDHNYGDITQMCNGPDCDNPTCDSDYHITLPKNATREGWKTGRRIVDLGFLLDNLKFCAECRLGPVSLTIDSVIGELRKGLGGYLYVKCQNNDCGHVNRVPYGKTHRVRRTGMPCFTANTKLGVAMIDSVGGSGKVNNLLSTLNIQPISKKNLQHIERRAGGFVESVAETSIKTAAQDAFQREMSDIASEETKEAAENMEGLIEDLGVCPISDASPSLKLRIQPNGGSVEPETPVSDTPQPYRSAKRQCRKSPRVVSSKVKKRLLPHYPCMRRTGMSCAVDTAWQKRGFDSLTAHTMFMSKSCYGKKVVKCLISHRQCSTCNWWRRNRPDRPVRDHRCVKNHTGSSRMMESKSGEKGVLELAAEGTPVEYLEGDGDTTLLARLKTNQNISMKKRFDKNHIMKNIGKSLYSLQSEKGVKISKNTICHLQKCVSYALSKNSRDEDGLQENLRAIIPHNFGDHQFCKAVFCGKLRTEGDKYVHRSLPYKNSLTGEALRTRLDNIMKPIIANASQLSDLGSSQQCEHANREVSLRAPKNIHYGETEALDYRVQATSAFINEGRHYITQDTHHQYITFPSIQINNKIIVGDYLGEYCSWYFTRKTHTQLC